MKKILAAIKPFDSLLFFAMPVVVGGALLFWAATKRSALDKRTDQEQARTLRVLEVQPITVVPRAVGFGESKASQLFQATAEIKGKITKLHPELKAGSFVRQNELLIAIDTTDFDITIQKLEAEIDRSEASLAELKASKKNLDAAIAIEQSSLEVTKREFDRLEELARKNSVSAGEVDQQRRKLLSQQQSVQNLQSNINLLPAQIDSAEAAIAVSHANLVSAKRDLERCRIVAPFNCRLGPVDLELNEFVAVGQQLVTAQSIDKIEVEAQFGLDKVARLIRPNSRAPRIDIDQSANPQELLREFFDVDVTLHYGVVRIRNSRKAQFERLREQLDATARTLGIVVSVERPYERNGTADQDGPPPVPGTYCEVELRGAPLKEVLVVPRSAIRDEAVFIVDGENRLRKRDVKVGLVQDNFATVLRGLSAGDRVVISDPTPAIEGMLVNPSLDTEFTDSMKTPSGSGR